MAILLGNIAIAQGDGTDMSRSENTNKWSKRKWVRYNSRSKLTDTQMKEVNYGFDIPVFTRSTLYGATLPSDRVWKYLQPRSGTDPSRMCDMEGYFHNAQKKNIRLVPPYSNNEMYINEVFRFGMETEVSGTDSTLGLKVADLRATGSYTGSIIGLSIVLVFFERNSNGNDYAKYAFNTGWTVSEVIEIGHFELDNLLPFAANSVYTIAAFASTNVKSMTVGQLYTLTDSAPDMGYLIPLSMDEDDMSKSEVEITFLAKRPVVLPLEDFRIWQARISGKNGTTWTISESIFIMLANDLKASKYNMKIKLYDDNGHSSTQTIRSEWSENTGSDYIGYDYICSYFYFTFTPFSGFDYTNDTLYVDIYIEVTDGSGQYEPLREHVRLKWYEDE